MKHIPSQSSQHSDTACRDPLPATEEHPNVISFRKWQDKKEAAREAVQIARLSARKTWREREEDAAALDAFADWCEEGLAQMGRTEGAD